MVCVKLALGQACSLILHLPSASKVRFKSHARYIIAIISFVEDSTEHS